jgi:cation transport ATPase
MQQLADVLAGRFAVFVTVIAVTVFCTWLTLLIWCPSVSSIVPNEPPFVTALTLAISTLVISCPCAMGTCSAIYTAMMFLHCSISLLKHMCMQVLRRPQR